MKSAGNRSQVVDELHQAIFVFYLVFQRFQRFQQVIFGAHKPIHFLMVVP